MWQRAKEAFYFYRPVDTFYFTSDLDYSHRITTAAQKSESLQDKTIHTITRQQVEEHFREQEVKYQPEICNKPLCRCIEIAEQKNSGNPVKDYPCLAKIEPEQLKSEFRSKDVKAEAIFTENDMRNCWHASKYFFTTNLQNLCYEDWITDYLTSKQAK